MKVLLINPPRENELTANNPAIIEEERGYNPPLGLLYIAGYLEQQSSHDVSVIDAQVEELDYAALEARIRAIRPDVVGVTAMTLTLIDVLKTTEVVKRTNPNIKIVLGGPHVHLFPEETIRLVNVDFLVLGEGEETFKELLDGIDDRRHWRSIPGLVFKGEAGSVVNTGIRPPIADLDKLPFPARHLVPYKKYTSLLSRDSVTTTMFSSRGCPFQCSFCDRPHLGKSFRARSAGNVVDEIAACTKMGIHEFLFYDDTFCVDQQRALDICDEIMRRHLAIRWDIRTRVDTVNENLLRRLGQAGCRGIHYGIEAGSERILKVLNKRITIARAQEVFALTRKYHIPILAYFMIGNPGETLAEIQATFKTMMMLKPDYVHITILTPFPGTKIYIDGLKRGVFPRDHWREFAADPRPGFVPPHWDESFSREELNILLRQGYRRFYFRPAYIVQRLLKVRSLNEFKKKTKAGLKILAMK